MKTVTVLNGSKRGGQSGPAIRIPNDPQAPFFDFDVHFIRKEHGFLMMDWATVESESELGEIYVLLCTKDPDFPNSCDVAHFLGRLTGISNAVYDREGQAVVTLSAMIVSRPGQSWSFIGAGSEVTWNWRAHHSNYNPKLVIRPSYDKLFLSPAGTSTPNITSWALHDTLPFMVYKMKANAQETVWNTSHIDFTSRASTKFGFAGVDVYSDLLMVRKMTLTTDEGEMFTNVPLFSLLGYDSKSDPNHPQLLWSCLTKIADIARAAPAVMAMGHPMDSTAVYVGSDLVSEYTGTLTFTALGAERIIPAG